MKKILFSTILGLGVVMTATARPIFDVNNVMEFNVVDNIQSIQNLYNGNVNDDRIKKIINDVFNDLSYQSILEIIFFSARASIIENGVNFCGPICLVGRELVEHHEDSYSKLPLWREKLQKYLHDLIPDTDFIDDIRKKIFNFDNMYMAFDLLDSENIRFICSFVTNDCKSIVIAGNYNFHISGYQVGNRNVTIESVFSGRIPGHYENVGQDIYRIRRD